LQSVVGQKKRKCSKEAVLKQKGKCKTQGTTKNTKVKGRRRRNVKYPKAAKEIQKSRATKGLFKWRVGPRSYILYADIIYSTPYERKKKGIQGHLPPCTRVE
jgi:hypothetical protein